MRASKAIKGYFDKMGADIKIVDALEYINPILNKTVTEGYEYLAKKKPGLYKIMYNSSNNRVIGQLVVGINNIIGRKLLPLIDEYNPDLLISTHPFCTEMVSKLKVSGKISTPIICIMTDYAPHRTWINDGVDAYVVSNEGMIDTMAGMGVSRDIIHSFGIPIEDAFYTKRDRNIILKEMGLNPQIPTILVMAGSFGVNNIINIYKQLLRIDLKFQIIVITGRNRRLYNAIEDEVYGRKEKKNRILVSLSKYVNPIKKSWRYIKKTYKGESKELKTYKKDTRILYFTNEVEKYMQISDLIITKPGGLTITEALACNLPMAIFDAIPGQEEENAEFLVSNNMAVKLDKGSDNSEIIKNLFQNTHKLRSMRHSCETFDKSDSLKNIWLLAENTCNRVNNKNTEH